MSGKRLSASSATGVGTLCSLLPAPCRWLSLSPAPPSHNPAISAGLMLPTPSPSVPRTLQRPVLQLPDSWATPGPGLALVLTKGQRSPRVPVLSVHSPTSSPAPSLWDGDANDPLMPPTFHRLPPLMSSPAFVPRKALPWLPAPAGGRAALPGLPPITSDPNLSAPSLLFLQRTGPVPTRGCCRPASLRTRPRFSPAS